MSIYALSQRAGETCDAAGKAMQDVFAVLVTQSMLAGKTYKRITVRDNTIHNV